MSEYKDREVIHRVVVPGDGEFSKRGQVVVSTAMIPPPVTTPPPPPPPPTQTKSE